MINNEQRSNYWNYVARNAKGMDDREALSIGKREYKELCYHYATSQTSQDAFVYEWILDRYPTYPSKFLAYFFHVYETEFNWKVRRSPLWDYFCGELVKTYNSLRLDNDLTYLASCAIMNEIRLIECEGYEVNEDDNNFQLPLPIRYILALMTKGQKQILARSIYAFSNFELMRDSKTGDDFLEMREY